METEGFEVVLTDATGHENRVPIKSGRPVNLPRVVLYGGQAFTLEHSRLREAPDFKPDQVVVKRTWVGIYRHCPVFSVDLEQELPVLHDPTDAQEMLADGIAQALDLAKVCRNCGKHVSECDVQSLTRGTASCCSTENCTHQRYERCGAVAKGQRGVPDGWACLKPKGHDNPGEFCDPWHAVSHCTWPAVVPVAHAGSPSLSDARGDPIGE